jgi:hypothetical protein
VGIVVQDGVRGCNPRGRVRRWLPRVEVAIKAWEVAAGEFEPEAVTGAEDIARSPKVDGEQISLSGNEEIRQSLGIPVASAQDALCDIDGRTIWCNVEEFSGEVGVHRRGCGEQFEADWSGDFDVMIERRGRIDQDVISFFNQTLVARTRGEMISIAA